MSELPVLSVEEYRKEFQKDFDLARSGREFKDFPGINIEIALNAVDFDASSLGIETEIPPDVLSSLRGLIQAAVDKDTRAARDFVEFRRSEEELNHTMGAIASVALRGGFRVVGFEERKTRDPRPNGTVIAKANVGPGESPTETIEFDFRLDANSNVWKLARLVGAERFSVDLP